MDYRKPQVKIMDLLCKAQRVIQMTPLSKHYTNTEEKDEDDNTSHIFLVNDKASLQFEDASSYYPSPIKNARIGMKKIDSVDSRSKTPTKGDGTPLQILLEESRESKLMIARIGIKTPKDVIKQLPERISKLPKVYRKPVTTSRLS